MLAREAPKRRGRARGCLQHATERFGRDGDWAQRGQLAKAVAVRVLRVVQGRDFELGRTRIFLRRGVWQACMERQRQLLRVIGPYATQGGATGLRKVRVARVIATRAR